MAYWLFGSEALASHQPDPSDVPAIPLLLAGVLVTAVPLDTDPFLPFQPFSGREEVLIDQATGAPLGPVEPFDPVGRAQLLARQLPRRWSGSYQSFGTGAVVPVTLRLSQVKPMGAMVSLRGEMSIAGVMSPVQGNLNAKSDQLALIPLAEQLGGGLQAGGEFQGLQGLELSGWNSGRLTDRGGRLALKPSAVTTVGRMLPSSTPPQAAQRPRQARRWLREPRRLVRGLW